VGPDRLGEAKVIRSDEAAAARFKTLVPGQVTDFTLGWCTVTVTRERFAVESAEPPFVKISDFIQKAISELMPQASVTAMGINRAYTIRFSSPEERDRFGTRLVPPSSWGNWGRRIQQTMATDDDKHGGVLNVTMKEFPIADREGGARHVTVAADVASNVSAQIIVNDHFQAPADSSLPAALEPDELARRRTNVILRALAEQFDASLNLLETIATEVVNG